MKPFLIALCTLPAAALAQDVVSSVYGDWTTICDRRADVPLCEATTSASNSAGQGIKLAYGPPPPDGTPHNPEAGRLAVLLPQGVSLRRAPVLSLSETEITLSYLRCDLGACLADADLPDGLPEGLGDAPEITLSFAMANGQEVRATLSGKGFGAAVAALSEQP